VVDLFLGMSVVAPVLAAGLFRLSNYTLYVFLSCFCGEVI